MRNAILCTVLLVVSPACSCSPYYSPVGIWTTEDQLAAEHYYRSMRANKEYLRIIKSGDVSKKFTHEERMELIRQLDVAITEAYQVLAFPGYCQKMHPDFREHFRDEYLRSLEMTRKNFDFPNFERAELSDTLYNTYIEWFLDHQKEIKIPKGK